MDSVLLAPGGENPFSLKLERIFFFATQMSE